MPAAKSYQLRPARASATNHQVRIVIVAMITHHMPVWHHPWIVERTRKPSGFHPYQNPLSSVDHQSRHARHLWRSSKNSAFEPRRLVSDPKICQYLAIKEDQDQTHSPDEDQVINIPFSLMLHSFDTELRRRRRPFAVKASKVNGSKTFDMWRIRSKTPATERVV